MSDPHLEAALAHSAVGDDLHAILQPEESLDSPKVYVVRGWCAIDANGIPPGALSWLIASTSLAEAEARSRPILLILRHLLGPAEAGDETSAIEAALLARIRLLTQAEGAAILSDIGVPTHFDSRHHTADEVLVIPFTALTGFTDAHVGHFAPLAPRPVCVAPDPFKARHRFA